jgi:antitoxin component HigA of HigAB toxin-antitoxin module
MVYFKDAPAPLPPSKLDFGQIEKIAKFRESLGVEGTLYWSFQKVEEFEKLVRLHLTRQVQTYKPSPTAATPSTVNLSKIEPASQHDEPIESEDLGFLDLMEQFEDELEIVKKVTDHIVEATEEVGKKMNERTKEISEFSSGSDADNRNQAKRLIANAASDMDQYTHRMEAELPLFKVHLNNGLTSLTKAAAISIEFNRDNKALSQAKENVEAVKRLRESMTKTEAQMLEFENSVASLPRLTKVLNQSKSAMIKVINRLQEELRSAQALAREAEISYAAILKNE